MISPRQQKLSATLISAFAIDASWQTVFNQEKLIAAVRLSEIFVHFCEPNYANIRNEFNWYRHFCSKHHMDTFQSLWDCPNRFHQFCLHHILSVSGRNKCSFFGKFDMLCFVVEPFLRFSRLSYFFFSAIFSNHIQGSRDYCQIIHIQELSQATCSKFSWECFQYDNEYTAGKVFEYRKIWTRNNSVFGHFSRSK